MKRQTSPKKIIYTQDFKEFVKQFHLPTVKCQQQYDVLYDLMKDNRKQKNYMQIKSNEYKLSYQNYRSNTSDQEKPKIKTFSGKVVIKRKVLNDYLTIVNKRGEILDNIKNGLNDIKDKSDKYVGLLGKWYNKEFLDEIRELFTEIGPMYKYQLNTIEKNAEKMVKIVANAQKRVGKKEKELLEKQKEEKRKQDEEREKRRRENRFWYLLEKQEQEQEQQELAKKAKNQDQEARIHKIKGYLLSSQDVEAGKRDVQKMTQLQLYGSEMQKKEIFEEDMKNIIKNNKRKYIQQQQLKRESQKKNQEQNNNKQQQQSQKIESKTFNQIPYLHSMQSDREEAKPFYSPRNDDYLQQQLTQKERIFQQHKNRKNNNNNTNTNINTNISLNENSLFVQFQKQNNNNTQNISIENASTQKSSNQNINMYKSFNNNFNNNNINNNDISNSNNNISNNLFQNDSIINTTKNQIQIQTQRQDYIRSPLKKSTMPNLKQFNKSNSNQDLGNQTGYQQSPRTNPSKYYLSYNNQNQNQKQNQIQMQTQRDEDSEMQIQNKGSMVDSGSNKKYSLENVQIQKRIHRKNKTMTTIIQKPSSFSSSSFQSNFQSNFNSNFNSPKESKSLFQTTPFLKSPFKINNVESQFQSPDLQSPDNLQQQSNILNSDRKHLSCVSYQNEKAGFLSISPSKPKLSYIQSAHLSPINQSSQNYYQIPQGFGLDISRNKQKVILGDDKIEFQGEDGKTITQTFKKDFQSIDSFRNSVWKQPFSQFYLGNSKNTNQDQKKNIEQIPSNQMIQPFQMPLRSSLYKDNQENNNKKQKSVLFQDNEENDNNNKMGNYENTDIINYTSYNNNKILQQQQEKKKQEEIVKEEEEDENANQKEDIFKYNRLTKVYIDKFYKGKLLGLQNDVAPIYTQFQLEEIENLKKKRTAKFANAKSRLFDFKSPKLIETEMCRENQQIIEQHGAQILNMYSNVQRQCGKVIEGNKKQLKTFKKSKSNSNKDFRNVKKNFAKSFGNKDIEFWKMENSKFNKIQEEYWKKQYQKQQEQLKLEKQRKKQFYVGEDQIDKELNEKEKILKQKKQRELKMIRRRQLEYSKKKAINQIEYYENEKTPLPTEEEKVEDLEDEENYLNSIQLGNENSDLSQNENYDQIVQEENSNLENYFSKKNNFDENYEEKLTEQQIQKDFDSQGHFTEQVENFIKKSKKHDKRRKRMEQKDKEFEKLKPKTRISLFLRKK